MSENMISVLRKIRDDLNRRFEGDLDGLVEHIRGAADRSEILEHWRKTGALVNPPDHLQRG